jgi:hypothetical protein
LWIIFRVPIMKLFKCQCCQLLLFFENRVCGGCGHTLGYIPVENALAALEPDGSGAWRVVAGSGATFRFCANASYDACNWLIASDSAEQHCIACRHNRMVPDLTDAQNLIDWRKLEFAKHRLFYTLLRLKLPLPNRVDDVARGLAFDFLADPVGGGKKVLTGHEDGLITLALKEADDAAREARRTALHEPYRTLLGHFRHEVGHFYWDRLVADGKLQEECRAVFGDDREDYGEALKRHYNEGAPPDWQGHFVSAYAASHAWEDFAETWAHYLHIVDSLETAKCFGLEVHPEGTANQELHTDTSIDPYGAATVEQLVELWLPLTYAMNAMNRSMGLGDIYPFVLSPEVIGKLAFIHRLVHMPRVAQGQDNTLAPLQGAA